MPCFVDIECLIPSSMTPADPPRRTTGSDAAIAGMLGLAVTLLVAAAGYGIGSLFGWAIPCGIAGLFVGFGVGIAVVITRFRSL